MSEETAPRVAGSMRGKIHVPDDFDAPLPPEVLARFVGESEAVEETSTEILDERQVES